MKNKKTGSLFVASLSALLSSLGTSIVNIALPSLTTYFSADLQMVQWVVIAYLLSMTVFVLISGKLADRYGYRRVLLFGSGVFALASFLAVFASDILLLILLRALQGVGAAALSTMSIAIIKNDLNRERIGTAMGLLGTLSAVGTALGPSIGGSLLAHLGWPSVFWLLAVAGALILLAGPIFIPDETPATISKDKENIRLNEVGWFVSAVSAYALAMVFSRNGISVYSPALLLVAGVSGWQFYSRQKRSINPLLNVDVLANRPLIGSLFGNFLISNVMMTTLIVGPFFLAFGLRLTNSEVGWVMSAGPLISILTGMPSGAWVDRAGTVLTKQISVILMITGTLSLAMLPAVWGWRGYLFGIVLLTPGYQLFQAANNTAIMTAAAVKQEGVISGVLNLSRNIGLVTGASLMGGLFSLSVKNAPGRSNDPVALFFGLKVTFLFASLLLFVYLLTIFLSKYHSRSDQRKP